MLGGLFLLAVSMAAMAVPKNFCGGAEPRVCRGCPRPAAATAEPLDLSVREASSEDLSNSAEAYELWREQFPIAAARREYYGLNCTKTSVQERFLSLAELLGISSGEALDMFRKDVWVLSEATDTLPAKLDALRSVADSEEEVLDFLRFAPRSIATTAAREIRQRGIANMMMRSSLGEFWELLSAPLRLLIKQQAKAKAAEIEAARESNTDLTEEQMLQQNQTESAGKLRTAGYAFFASLVGLICWASYMDTTYGGPIHGKGFCFPAGVMPAYNLPDVEGNARLPCNCAPLYKWYLEPLMSAAQKEDMMGAAPKVESKNCGRSMGGAKRECDPRTVGGCVWTQQDLERDPSYWEGFTPLFWEKQRASAP